MKTLLAILISIASLPAFACDSELLDRDFRKLASTDEVNLCKAYGGKVLLVVNTASKCGNTPQYDGLEKLYEQYGEEGLVVLGFPSNDFLASACSRDNSSCVAAVKPIGPGGFNSSAQGLSANL